LRFCFVGKINEEILQQKDFKCRGLL